MKDFSCSKHCF